MQLVIVTGMSGAGKSRAIDNLEDIGFFCVDNMTPQLIPTFVKILKDSTEVREKVAIVADVRLGNSFSELFKALDELRIMECEYKILFIDADNDVILRRYQETRRKHPLSSDDSSQELLDIIIKERELLKKARNIADYVIDTSLITTSQLKERIAELFLDDISNTLKINVVSFGFKYGIPKDSEISGKIVAGSCGNHTKADTLKIRNAIQHFIDSSVSPYHQQIDGSFRNLSTDLSGKLHCMFFITGQICVI